MSRIRADQLVNRAGSGGPKFPNGVAEGFSVSGIVTATSYRGDGSQLEGIDASTLKDGNNVKVEAVSGGANITGNVAATGNINAVDVTASGNVSAVDGTFSGNLTVQGTTTTIDTAVTAVDSLAVDGSVAIGTDSPSASHNLTVRGSNDTTFTNNPSNIFVAGTDTSGSGNSGAGINFGGRYRDDNGNATAFAVVSGIKENTTHNNWAGALTFATRTHGNTGGNQERLRITSTGDVGINCIPHSNAGVNLHIHGDNTTSEIRLTNTTTGTGANGSYIQQGGNTLYIGNTESGNTVFEVNGSERLRVTSDGKVRLPDNGKLTLGAGDDLQIWSDNTDQYIRGEQNQLIVRSNNLRLQSYLGENYIHCAMNNAVSLYYDNVKKLETTATGVEVSGATKTDTLEVTQEYPSIRPTLDLNFAATKTLDRRITFTRDSLGTYVGEDGLVKYASNNVPRFDHNPDTRESLGLLIEESRTNFITYSENFSQGWNTIRATISTNTTTAPDGTTTADSLIPNSFSNSDGYTRFYYTVSNTGNYSYSIFVKQKDSYFDYVYFNAAYDTQSGTAQRAWFRIDPGNGAVGTTSGGATATIEEYPNGWYRCTINTTSDATGSVPFVVVPVSADSTTSFNGDGSMGVYVWGAQIEHGTFATSYIPTSGSTVTRAVDTATIKGTNFSSWFSKNKGTVYSQFKNIRFGAGMYYFGPGSSPRWYSRYELTNGVSTQAWDGSGGSGLVNITVPGVSNNETIADLKHVLSIDNISQQHVGSANGSDVVTGTWDDISNVSTLTLGRRVDTNSYLNGHISCFKYYPERLPNAQLQGLTQQ